MRGNLRAKVDANQNPIVRALEQCGATVQDLSPVGEGCPDILVGFCGRLVLMEIKDPQTGRLTAAQQLWHERWKGPRVLVVTSVEEALACIGGRVQ